jgi:hydrogenase nickel incorporation protein HypA/HybF
MHELFIAQSIIQTVRNSLPNDVDAARVREIHVECGKLDAVIPENLEFLFNAIKSQSHLDMANLQIVEIDVRCRCRGCGHEFSIDIPLFLCPSCQSGDVEVVTGRGIRLVKLCVDD